MNNLPEQFQEHTNLTRRLRNFSCVFKSKAVTRIHVAKYQHRTVIVTSILFAILILNWTLI